MSAETVTGARRVEDAFAVAREQGRAALVVYLTAGYPDVEVSRACFEAAAAAGADVLEVGLPFSDPMMDGPVIQRANQHVLETGLGVTGQLELVASLDVEVPTLAMTYVTVADTRGYERFADELAAAGCCGAILPDLPAPEAADWLTAARRHDLATVFLAASVSTDERLARIAAASSGFVYATGLLGVTGVKDVAQDDARELVTRLREHTDTPIAVGIGVKDRRSAAAVAAYADGVIVGSSVIRTIADGDPAGAPERVGALVRELRRGVEDGGARGPHGQA
jgi:tryptophan synthase alpha chain